MYNYEYKETNRSSYERPTNQTGLGSSTPASVPPTYVNEVNFKETGEYYQPIADTRKSSRLAAATTLSTATFLQILTVTSLIILIIQAPFLILLSTSAAIPFIILDFCLYGGLCCTSVCGLGSGYNYEFPRTRKRLGLCYLFMLSIFSLLYLIVRGVNFVPAGIAIAKDDEKWEDDDRVSSIVTLIVGTILATCGIGCCCFFLCTACWNVVESSRDEREIKRKSREETYPAASYV